MLRIPGIKTIDGAGASYHYGIVALCIFSILRDFGLTMDDLISVVSLLYEKYNNGHLGGILEYLLMLNSSFALWRKKDDSRGLPTEDSTDREIRSSTESS